MTESFIHSTHENLCFRKCHIIQMKVETRIQYDMKEEFNVDSKTDRHNQLNLANI